METDDKEDLHSRSNIIQYYNGVLKRELRTDALLFERGVLPQVVYDMDWELHYVMGLYREQFESEEYIKKQYAAMNANNPSAELLAGLKKQAEISRNKLDRAPMTRV